MKSRTTFARRVEALDRVMTGTRPLTAGDLYDFTWTNYEVRESTAADRRLQ